MPESNELCDAIPNNIVDEIGSTPIGRDLFDTSGFDLATG